MRILIEVVLDKRRPKSSGLYAVKVRVTYLRQQKYYYVGLDMSQDEYDKVMSLKVKLANKDKRVAIDNRLTEIRNAIDGLSNFSFGQLDVALKSTVTDANDIFPLFERMYQEKIQEEKFGTASTYKSSIRSFKEFQGRIGYFDITPSFLKRYEASMLKKGRSATTVGINVRNLRTLYNKAVAAKIINDSSLYPFKKSAYKIPKGKNIKKALDKEEIMKIYHFNDYHAPIEKWAKEMWILSYLLNGINPSDLFRLSKADFDDGYISFYRKKTEDSSTTSLPIVIYVRDEAKQIIEYWSKDTSPFLVNGLEEGMSEEQKFKTIHQKIKMINDYMKRIASRIGIDKPCTCYYARHSFAQALKNSGAPIELISESLGHSSITTTRHYLNSFKREMVKKAADSLL
jgi:integrase/recombinase XerD